MSRLSEEIRLIPWPAWLLAICAAGAVFAYLAAVAFPGGEMRNWPLVTTIVFIAVIPAILFTWVLLIVYIYADARRRGMRYVMWTLLAILIPNAIGIVLYFILREPPRRSCPRCGTVAPRDSVYCPACGAQMLEACPQCRLPVKPGWSHCPQCGSRLKVNAA